MTIVPSLPFQKVLRAFQRDGWIIVGQEGSHIKLKKRSGDAILKVIVPAHRPIKRSTLSHILKQAKMDLSHFLDLL